MLLDAVDQKAFTSCRVEYNILTTLIHDAMLQQGVNYSLHRTVEASCMLLDAVYQKAGASTRSRSGCILRARVPCCPLAVMANEQPSRSQDGKRQSRIHVAVRSGD